MGDPSNIDIGWRSALMFALCLPLLAVAGILFVRRIERSANAFLACFLIAVIASQIPQIIGFSNFYSVWPGLTFAPFNTELWIGPLLYLHADRLMRDGPLGWRKWLIVPGLAQTGYYLWAFLSLGDYKAKWAYTEAIHSPYVMPIETGLGLGLAVLAFILIYRLLGRYRLYLENTQSAARDFDPVWISRLIYAGALAGVFFALVEIVPYVIPNIGYTGEYPILVAMVAIILWLALEALGRTGVPFPKMPDVTTALAVEQGPSKDWTAEGTNLKRAVEKGDWHLEPRLTIRDVASRMATNETYISRALNTGLGMSFNSFINGLRVDIAKTALTETNASILEIALSSGFNSKATFNRVFKDRAGMTPSQYRASQKP